MSLRPGARCHTVLNLQENTCFHTQPTKAAKARVLVFLPSLIYLLYMKNGERKKPKRVALFPHFR